MGAKEAKIRDGFHYYIASGRDGKVNEYLLKYPELVNCQIEGVSNPICRASYLGFQNVISVLLKHGANINQPSK